MSYLVLARKYRPATFDEVAAQELVVSTLKAAIEKGKVSHAYLFTGPRGSGKTTVARVLAKALNCEKGPTSSPCNACPRCKDINAGVSLDVIEIDGASHNSVEDVRELVENVRYATAGGKRIYIIDEVHMLSGAAFNALLKTLEEPPPHAVFVLATTEVSKIPATILSRCQRFDFRRIPPAALTSTLQNICRKEGVEIEPEALAVLVRKADGSLRDGLSLLDQVWTLSAGKITKKSVGQALGLLGLELFFELTDAFSAKDAARTLEVFDQISAKGADLEDFLDQLLLHLRNLLVARWKKQADELLGLSDLEREEYSKRAEQFAEGDLLRMMRQVADLKLNLSRLTDPKILIEAELVKLAWLDSTVDLKEVLEEIRGGGSGGLPEPFPKVSKVGSAYFPKGGGAPAAAPPPSAGAPSPSLKPERPTASAFKPSVSGSLLSSKPVEPVAVAAQAGQPVEDAVWKRVLEAIRRENPGHISFWEQARPYFNEAGELILPFSRSYEGVGKLKFSGKGNGKKFLDELFNSAFGRKVVWKMEFAATSGAASAHASPPSGSSFPNVDDWLEKYPELKKLWEAWELEAVERKPNLPADPNRV